MNKLATGITAVAIATTAIAVPAKADNKDLNTLLAILAGGLVIHEIIDNKKDRKKAETTSKRDKVTKKRDERITHQHRDGRWHTHRNLEELKRYHRKDRHEARRDKPKRFDHPIQDRLFQLPIPDRCQRTLSGRFGQTIHGVSRRCLRKHGYKIENNGRVTHPDFRNRAARPRLL